MYSIYIYSSFDCHLMYSGFWRFFKFIFCCPLWHHWFRELGIQALLPYTDHWSNTDLGSSSISWQCLGGKKWRCAINWLMWVFRTCLICVQTQFERAMRLGTNFSVISLENCPGVACAFNRPDEPRDSNHGGSHSFLSVLFHRRLDSVVPLVI
jgi:hypothetical protein